LGSLTAGYLRASLRDAVLAGGPVRGFLKVASPAVLLASARKCGGDDGEEGVASGVVGKRESANAAAIMAKKASPAVLWQARDLQAKSRVWVEKQRWVAVLY
jgi:hypothetical protein